MMTKDGKIHIPGRRKERVTENQAVKLTAEAYNAVVDIYNESSTTMTRIVSEIILQSLDRIVYDKEE